MSLLLSSAVTFLFQSLVLLSFTKQLCLLNPRRWSQPIRYWRQQEVVGINPPRAESNSKIATLTMAARKAQGAPPFLAVTGVGVRWFRSHLYFKASSNAVPLPSSQEARFSGSMMVATSCRV